MNHISLLFRNKSIKSFSIIFAGFILLFISNTVLANVAITAATGGTGICVDKACGGSATAYTTLGNIQIRECNGCCGDIPHPCGGFLTSCTVTLVLNAPTGWQFGPTLPTVTYNGSGCGFGGGSDILSITRAFSGAIGCGGYSQLTLTITDYGAYHRDRIIISGLQVKATSSASAAGHIYASGGSGISGITAGSSTTGSDFGDLSQTGGATPTITIAASPSTTVCPGAVVTFNATTTGTITSYQWYVNGVPTATGNPFVTSTLTSGSTVYCIITAPTCGGTTTVTSNTITMTVTGPGLISGNPSMCVGSFSSFSDATAGGTWSSTASGTASIGTSGIALGVSAGTATISYYPGAGCAATLVVTVSAGPATPTITPASASICNGGNVTLTAAGTFYPDSILHQDFNSGLGTWTVDTVGSSTGIFLGSQWKVDGDGYVNELGIYHSPDNTSFVMANTDTSGVGSVTSTQLYSPSFSLVGYTAATLTFQQCYVFDANDNTAEIDISTDGGLSWSTLVDYWGTTVGSYASFATQTIDLTPYIGFSNVKLEFNYSSNYGLSWSVDNVNITGISSITGPIWTPTTYLYSNPSFTYTYSGTSTNPVYVHPTSVIATTVVTYTATVTDPTNGCFSTSTSIVTINPVPAAITGTFNVCTGLTTTLTDVTAGGAWSSTTTGVGTVDATGHVTGTGSGTTTISYTSGSGCAATAVVTVAAVPGSILGTLTMCNGSSSALSDLVAGGTWSSSNATVGTIGSTTGIVTGVATGTTVITYATSSVCYVTATVSVTAPPNAIGGPATSALCQSATTPLFDATGGGTWTSSNSGIASLSGSTGSPVTVSGVSGGTATITYALNATCYVTRAVTVIGTPAAISGLTIVCTGSTITLSDAVSGGTWSSSTTAVGSVGSATGVVTGISIGTTTITYSTGCAPTATITVTVTAAPTAISGPTSVCVGATITMSDGTSPGTWSSSNTAVGTIGSTTGIVYGAASGSTTITYTTICGFITQVITVNAQPTAINGTLSVCNTFSTSLSDAVSGGAWSSVNTAVGTIDAVGNVTGVSVGTTQISYAIGGCYVTAIVTVNTQPTAIVGVTSFCNSSINPLTDGTAGGAWTSGNTAVGTVDAFGNVRGLSVGTSLISYTIGSCASSLIVTVTAQPTSINGTLSFCNLATVSLSDAIGGGTWTSVNTAVATITGTGAVTGHSVGTSTISYTVGSCYAIAVVTVNPQPSAITGVTSFCNLSTTALTDAVGPGTWTSTNTAVGTVDASGNVTGISVGTSVISYTIGSCYATTTVSVNTQPAPISGTLSFCNTFTTSLSDITPGGTWTSVTTAVATVGTSGIVTGHLPGTSVISYTIGSCASFVTVTVNTQPAAISGTLSFCNTFTTSLTDAVAGGTWTSVNTAVGTIDAVGNVTGISAGTTTISYTIGSCYVTAIATVNTQPGAITGVTSLCNLSTIPLTDATAGGVWTSTNTVVATVGGTGLVTGHAVGTSVISYTIGSCVATVTVNITTQPVGITGTLAVCNLATTSLTDATAGGIWTSSNTAVGTVDGVGNVTGVSVGTTTISYTIGSCSSTAIVTVNTQPGPITGATSLCNSSTVPLTDATAGGAWTSTNTIVATVGTSGLVTGHLVGTSVISYTIGSCTSTTTVNVTTQPAGITGTPTVCNLLTTNLTDATAGGIWTSTNTGVGTVDGFGHVTGVSVGTTTISYTIGSCTSTIVVTVNTQPGAIVGIASICNSGTTSLTDATPGGAWTSTNIAVGTVDGVGNVTAVSLGTTIVSYTIGSCASTFLVTVTTQPGPITGVASICNLSSSLLSDSPAGGTWSSVTTGVATIGSTSGVVTGVSVGTTMVSYSIGTCYSTTIVTVNTQPVAITGVASVCDLLTTSLTDATPGGAWTSVNTAVGTVDASGNVTGLSAGTTIISYTIASCTATQVVTVNPLPVAITGTMTVCVGLTTTLSDASGGGTWASTNPAIATINSSGVVTGVAAGTVIDTYTLPTGCIATATVTVNPLPSPITGATTVCVGSSISLTDGGGGTFSSTSGNVNVTASGTVTGISAGTAIITYTLPTTCITTYIVTVNPLPSSISGPTAVCVGSSISLTDAGGGTFSSTSVNVIVGTSGTVTGMIAGTAVITYTLPTSCTAFLTITINPLPSSITGPSAVCVGSSISLTDAGGGTFSSTSVNVTVGASGTVTGVNAGTAVITYTLPTGCLTTTVITVNPLPTPILGNLTVCVGYTTSLSDLSTGGTWSSSNANAAIGTSTVGIVNGVTIGTSVITYTLPTSCVITAVITVNGLPSAIMGTLTVCPGLTTSLSDIPGGGTWSSTSAGTGSASIGIGSGLVTGITAGTSSITYTIGTGCIMTTTVTINPLPSAILGTMTVCSGSTTSLSDATPGGTWSGTTAVATVGSSGLVTGNAVSVASTITVTYTISSTGCYMTTVVTVNPLPTTILGTLAVCSGLTTSLSDAATGGTWMSSATGTASISPTGIVTGVGASGTATITYTLPTTCFITTTVTVNPLPGSILGTLTVCPGLTTTLSDATTPGTFTSANTAIVTIGGSSGVATGVSPGTVLITYTLPTGCISLALLTVNPLPGPVLGNLSVCQGLSTTLSDASPSGNWSSSNSSIASVSGTGVVTGVLTGSSALTTATITYTLPTSCFTTATVTVNPLPAAITGTLNVCVGSTNILSDATPGGTWSSSNGNASMGIVTGYLTGVTQGTSTITYALPTTCISTAIATVNPLPAAITGTLNVCVGLTTALSDATSLGTWSSSNGNATINSGGVATGVSGGVSIITYALPTGCITVAALTVNPLPLSINGNLNVCLGLTTNLTDATPGGAWNNNNLNASITSSGVVTGLIVGTSIITYKLPTGCIQTATVTINPLPAAITGALNVCVNLTTNLTDGSAGGTWSSGNVAIGTVNSSTGAVTGIAPGTVIITYTLPTTCQVTAIVTVNPQPGPITGNPSVCLHDTTHLADATPGGTWSSSFPSVGSVGTTGIVAGLSVGTTTVVYSLAAGCNSLVVVSVNPLPAIYTVSGDSSYCQGGVGVPIFLSGSNVGISYLLYYDTSISATGYVAGTGSPLNFGLLTVGGTYTVLATDNTTGCTSNMAGSAFVTIIPTVNPLVSITTGMGDTVCPGTTVTFRPIPVNGGTSPTYKWSVNGVLVSLDTVYTYIPADGDIITVIMTSNGRCVMPLTGSNYLKIRVLPDANPFVGISIDPGDTVCQFAVATFTATPTFGGTAPIYTWYVNGLPQTGSGNIFGYYPATGDIVYCKMTSNYLCRLSDTAYSNVAVMTVAPLVIPHVDITASHTLEVMAGEYETLHAIATNAGLNPTYQWYVNGIPVTGATSDSLVSQFNNYDSVTCVITSSGVCEGISTFDWVYITVHPVEVYQYTGTGDIRLMPNPNTGVFTIKGTIGTIADEEATIEITDMIGQVIYRNKIVVQGGKINEQVKLTSTLANGMYLLNLRSGNENKVFHFMVEQ